MRLTNLRDNSRLVVPSHVCKEEESRSLPVFCKDSVCGRGVAAHWAGQQSGQERLLGCLGGRKSHYGGRGNSWVVVCTPVGEGNWSNHGPSLPPERQETPRGTRESALLPAPIGTRGNRGLSVQWDGQDPLGQVLVVRPEREADPQPPPRQA